MLLKDGWCRCGCRYDWQCHSCLRQRCCGRLWRGWRCHALATGNQTQSQLLLLLQCHLLRVAFTLDHNPFAVRALLHHHRCCRSRRQTSRKHDASLGCHWRKKILLLFKRRRSQAQSTGCSPLEAGGVPQVKIVQAEPVLRVRVILL